MSSLKTPVAKVSAASALLACMLTVAGLAMTAHGPEGHVALQPVAFTIPAEDGYGIAECMEPGQACGAVMADSWCESHGHRKSVAFGMGGDVTGAIPGQGETQPAAGDVLIRCGD